MKKAFVLLLVLAGSGFGGLKWWQRASETTASFRTAPVQRGNLLITISATGTLQPEEVIDVGAQVAGKIESFGSDPNNPGRPIDYGTMVEEGTVLANIDPALYAADVAQAEAQLAQAKANVAKAEADLVQGQARLRQAERNWRRISGMERSGALSAADYDTYEADYETAKAVVGVNEATLEQTRKAVLQAEAQLRRARTNLSYCTIKSPVKGVIIDRRVNIGQTVVSSLNAPSLFLIAKDLSKMQVWASVNEADIGSIRPGQAVTFTVDAYPGETFRGTVSKIRLNAAMTQNVVTYTVEITTDNPDGKLLPYLTANIRFEVDQRQDVLTVPNAALRWTPLLEQVAPESREAFQRGEAGGRRGAGGPGRGGSPEASEHEAGPWRPATVWVPEDGFARPVPVRAGHSDGSFTEIHTDNLKDGSDVITGLLEDGEGAAGPSASPFLPQFRRRGQGGAR